MDASASNPSPRGPRSSTERPRSYGNARIPFQAVKESERRIWQHFESYKRSAILHAEQYLRYSAVRKHDPELLIDAQLSDSAPRIRQESPTNWGREAARDNLYDDLQVLQSLSDHMLHVSKKRLPRYYALVATLLITTTLSASHTNSSLKKLWISSLAALSAASCYTGYRTLKFGVVYLCSRVIDSLRDRLDRKILDEKDKASLEGRRFQLLWWVYHLTASETGFYS